MRQVRTDGNEGRRYDTGTVDVLASSLIRLSSCRGNVLVAEEKPADASSERKRPNESTRGRQGLLLRERTLTFVVGFMFPGIALIVRDVAPNQRGVCSILGLCHLSKLHRVCRSYGYAEW